MHASFDVFHLLMQCGWTAVHVSAYNGHLAIVKELIESCGCSSDARDKVCLYVSKAMPSSHITYVFVWTCDIYNQCVLCYDEYGYVC